MIKERCTGNAVAFDALVEADFVCCARSVIDPRPTDCWFPMLIGHASDDHPFRLFAKAEAARGFFSRVAWHAPASAVSCLYTVGGGDDATPSPPLATPFSPPLEATPL